MMKSLRHPCASVAAVLCVAVCAALLAPQHATAVGYHPAGTWPASPYLSEPTDVAVALDGEIFVADSKGRRIAVYDSAGTLLREFDGTDVPGAQLRWPVAVALGPDARVYVADRESNRISVFERDGTFVRTWGGTGPGTTQFSGPFDIAFASNGQMLIADRFNNRVQVFTTQGAFVRKLTNANGPSALAVSGNEVFVAEATDRRFRVFRFDTGAYLREWGLTVSGGTMPVTTSRYSASLSGVHVADGKVHVSDAGLGIIERNTLDGVPEATMAAAGQPSGVAVAGGRIVFAEVLGGRIRIAPTSMVASETTTLAPIVTQDPEYQGPRVISVGPDGSRYVAETGANRVRKFAPTGEYLLTFEAPPGPSLSSPQGIVADHGGPAGEVYVSDTGNHRVLAYTQTGEFLAVVGGPGTAPGQFMAPKGLSAALAGYVAVVDSGNRRVQLLEPAQQAEPPYTFGAFSVQAPFGGSSRLTSPTAIVADPVVSSCYYVADEGRSQVVVFNSDGTWLRNLGGLGTDPGQFFGPQGIDIVTDAWGTGLLVADTRNDRVQRFAMTGPQWYNSSTPQITVLGSSGYGRGRLMRPADIAALSGGDVLVADTGGNRVVRFGYDATGPVTTVSGDVDTWVSRPATISLVATDTGSGVKLIEYQVKRPNGETRPWALYFAPFAISDEGTSVVTYRSTDYTDNVGTAWSVNVFVDMTPPAGSVVFASGAATVAPGPITVVSSMNDAWEMRVGTPADPGTWVPYSRNATIPVSGNGSLVVQASYRDRAGNVTTIPRTIVVDSSGPVTSISPAVPGSGVFSAPTTFTIGATDAFSSVAVRKYRLDGGPETTYTAPFRVQGNRAHTIEAWAVDIFGNVGDVTQRSFRISELAAGGGVSLAGGAAVVGNTTVDVATTVKGADLVRWDTGAGFTDWRPIPSPWRVEFSGEGTKTLSVEFKDEQRSPGGQPDETTFVHASTDDVVVDLSPPETTVRGLPARGGSLNAVLFWFAVTDRYADGPYTTQYRLNGGPVSTYSAPVEVPQKGTHLLEYRSVDRFSNTEEWRSASFVIVDAPEQGSFSVRGANPRDFVRATRLTLSVDTTQATEMRFAVDGGAPGDWIPVSNEATVAVDGEGVHLIEGEFRSILGEEYDFFLSRSVKVDRSAPTVSTAYYEPKRFTMTRTGLVRLDVRMRVRGYDPASAFGPPSGVSSWAVAAGPRSWSSGAVANVERVVDLRRIASGTAKVSVSLRDVVGNVSPRTGTLRVAAGKAPKVPSTLRRNDRFQVKGSVPVAGPKASYALHLYRRNSAGEWYRYRVVPVRPSISGSTATITKTIAIDRRGSYRVVLFSTAGLSQVMGRPSPMIAVR